ncbi:MAG: TetR/AcrR family transcriptional regulator [Selenomonas sp.]|uniref:TetR/AcrR family transcriptional regulator n=1 Tax=Selenomonas sp. TaxID=2053611 RepID=UPI0025D200D7|nr:TetR/AcrR family transcriptional regulator [Selenomonas sp.]MCR5758231.1 TetR/AcrR family transcriptional regulator [Selenomonas sp.]
MIETKVLDAAWEEAKIRSLRFTMSDVTRRLRMSKSSLYKLVPSKDELIHDMLSLAIERFNQEEKQLLSGDLSTREQINRFIKAYLSMMKPMMTAGFLEDLQLSYPEEYKRWEDFYAEKVAHCIDILRSGVEKGILRPFNLAVVQQCLYTSATALTDSSFLKRNNLTYEKAITDLEEILFCGLLR